MRTLTMVMRCGDINTPVENMQYTLIGTDYSFERMSGVELVKAIKSKAVAVTNMDVTDKGLVSTNGAMKNYTLVDTTGALVQEPKAVILNRVESDKGLLGYTMYNVQGVLQEITVVQAAELARANKIANGKIRHTQQGDIVASISGVYPLRTIKMADAEDKSISVEIMFIGSAIAGKQSAKYAGVIVNGKSAASLTKLYGSLVKDNVKIIEKVSGMSGKDEADSLAVKRTGTAGFYGVYTLDKVFDLIDKAGKAVKFPMGKILIACTDYDADAAESDIILSLGLGILDKRKGSSKSDEAIKVYAADLVSKLKAIKIS